MLGGVTPAVDLRGLQSVCRAPGARARSNGAQKRASSEIAVDRGEEAVQLGGVLGEASIARFAGSKNILEDVNRAERVRLPQAARRAAPEGAGKGLLHPRPHLGFGPLPWHGEFL